MGGGRDFKFDIRFSPGQAMLGPQDRGSRFSLAPVEVYEVVAV